MPPAPEFSRPVRIDALSAAPSPLVIEATPAECAALAARFDLRALGSLRAEAVLMIANGAPIAHGTLMAQATQACVATGDPVPVTLNVGFKLRFIDESALADQSEIELSIDDYDDMPLGVAGDNADACLDLGEAVAQSLVLALPPFPRSPHAEAALRAAGVLTEGEEPRGAFAGLKDLLKR